jgi:hypothetical protein
MFPVRYGLNFYILFRRNSAFKVLSGLHGVIFEKILFRVTAVRT